MMLGESRVVSVMGCRALATPPHRSWREPGRSPRIAMISRFFPYGRAALLIGVRRHQRLGRRVPQAGGCAATYDKGTDLGDGGAARRLSRLPASSAILTLDGRCGEQTRTAEPLRVGRLAERARRAVRIVALNEVRISRRNSAAHGGRPPREGRRLSEAIGNVSVVSREFWQRVIAHFTR